MRSIRNGNEKEFWNYDGGARPMSSETVLVETTRERPQRTRRDTVRMVLVSLGFAFGIMLIIWGVTGSVTGRDAIGLPDDITSVSPSPNDQQVLNQTEIYVDLEPNFEAALTVDGIMLDTTRLGEAVAEPGRQIELPPTAVYDPGNASIRFQPQTGAAIESWSRGTHVVTVEFWNVEVGREGAKRFTWSFTVL
jgi:hypothetical protein